MTAPANVAQATVPRQHPGCQWCERAAARAAAAIRDLENAEIDLRAARTKIGQLEARINRLELGSPDDDAAAAALEKAAGDVYAYWKLLCRPRSRAFAEEAHRCVVARLREGRTVEELQQAVTGAFHAAYVDEKGKRHDKLSLICRSDEYVLDFIGRAERFEAQLAEKVERFNNQFGIAGEGSGIADAVDWILTRERQAGHRERMYGQLSLEGAA